VSKSKGGKPMKSYGGLKFVLVVLIIAVISLLAYFGSETLGVPGISKMRTGIDIRGGVYAQLYPDLPEGQKATDEQLSSARIIIEKRLDSLNIYDRNITTETEHGRIIVEIPWRADEKDYNPQTTIDEIGKTALLTFREVDADKVDENGFYLPTDRIVIEGADVVDAYPASDGQGGMMVVLELTSEAQQKFAEATGRLVGEPIAIFMDEEFISAPIVKEKITPGSNAVIQLGSYTDLTEASKEAKYLADTIRAGALPFRLVAKNIRSISPLLGEGALKVAINAGIVSLALIFIFMLIRYRLPGLIANVALIGLVAGTLMLLSILGISLTLPGIAGIILSVGMGVDGNVIIFERIKEELKSGKTLQASIDVGFKRAFVAILDGNVTTLITAALLYWFGTGPIKGFAVTLFFGVLLSFITAVTASRAMLKSISSMSFARDHRLYGA